MTEPLVLVGFILAILAAETAILMAVSRGRPLAFRLQWVTGALAGGGLALALLAVLAELGGGWFLAALGGALVAHAADVALRWRLAEAPTRDP